MGGFPIPGGRIIALLAMALAAEVWAQAGFTEVQAILDAHCTMCHDGEAAPLGLELDSHEHVLAGSDRGPVVVPGDPAASELLRRIRGTSLPRMPLTGPPYLSEEQTELIADWIAAGAAGPDDAESAGQPPEQVGDGVREEGPVTYGDVAPLLSARCVKCHTDNGLMGAPPEGLRLASYEQVMSRNERAVVVPFAPLASELYRKVAGHSLPRMPLDGPPYLSDDEIRLVRDWIADGARDAQGDAAGIPTGARVRLGGTLTAPAELDGFPLEIGPATRIDDDPGTGDYVEVRGTVGPDGEIEVERIRRR